MKEKLRIRLNGVFKKTNAPYAIPAKVVSALIAVALFVTGCTGQISPTISSTEVKPAITAPLPTAERTQTPPTPPTPTEAPTATARARTDNSFNYPSAVSDRVLTDATLHEHKTAFATLVAENSAVAYAARKMETRLTLICGSTCTTEGVLDQTRWGIFARNSDGTPMVLQRTTDGGKTWLTISDASAYAELVDYSTFDRAAYKTIPLQRPSGIPADATGEVMTQNNWMVYVWREKASGKILAWYDAANDQYLTVDGKKLELAKTYAYKTLSEMTTWEECVAPEQQLPWIDDPEFEQAWKVLKTNDSKLKTPHPLNPGLTVFTLNFPSDDIFNFPITGPYGWNTSSLAQGGYGLVDTCGTLATPDGKHLNFVRVAIKMVPNVLRDDLGSSYIHLTFVVDQELLKKNWTKDPRGIYTPDEQPIEVQFHALQTLGNISIIPFTKDQPIGNEELTNPVTRDIASLIQRNQKEGIQEILIRALQAQATTEELLYLQEHAIIPVNYIVVSY